MENYNTNNSNIYKLYLVGAIALTSTKSNNDNRNSLDKLKNNKLKLNSLKFLNKNWDGYHAEKIDEVIIQKVENLLPNLFYQPQIFPTGRGTIQLEKYIDENNLIEIEVSNDCIFAYQVKNGVELEKVIEESEVNKIISELYE